MSASPANLHVRVDAADAATVLVVEGEIDVATADRLIAAVRELPGAGGAVVMNLEHVGFMDSTGVRALLECQALVEERGGHLGVLRPSSIVTRLLDLVDLRDRFVEVTEISTTEISRLTR